MRPSRIVLWCALLVLSAVPASATTLVRQGLEGLVADNEAMVTGRVLDLHSYWNDDHSFILTDVRVRLERSGKMKNPFANDVTFTVLGGTVGDITTLIVGGPEIVPGSDYVLFLNREDLPGAPARLTIRDLSQGIFNIEESPDGRVAVSQAIDHALLPDASGQTQPPGGEKGLPLEQMLRQVRQLAGER
jgi:hypothetical protein